jgi:hypothetical protein
MRPGHSEGDGPVRKIKTKPATFPGLTIGAAAFALYLTVLFVCVVWQAPVLLILVVSASPTVVVALRFRSIVFISSFMLGTVSFGIVIIWITSMLARLPVGNLGYLENGNLCVNRYKKTSGALYRETTGPFGITYHESLARDRAGTLITVRLWIVPLRSVALCSGVLAAACFGVWAGRTVFMVRRQLARMRAGQCLMCGYDLRGSDRRCPECGTEFDKHRNTTTATPE